MTKLLLHFLLFCLPLIAIANTGSDHIGSQACAQCHRTEFDLWQNSHHEQAMQPANNGTVLGDFNNASFNYNGVGSRFFRDGDRFMVETDGPKGTPKVYPVTYTFGVTPLQQYLIEFPGGRLQALGIAWDSREKSEGGQRWFHLYPDQNVDITNPLHWTRLSQTWNHQCAECHSTGLKKNYDVNSGSYNTHWQEISVGCEACHGPGKKHQQWAQTGSIKNENGLIVQLDERKGVQWHIDPKTGNAIRSASQTSNTEIELCARCHSRRSLLSEDYQHGQPLAQTHRPALLSQGLYHADGQVDDEVYVYGSFLQSKMYQQGVTCSDCHDPHSNELKIPGNGTCLQCHDASRFNTEEHHHHPLESSGSSCADCHMPTKTYMVVDPRHDHSFRIPRPDLSVELGTPNACNNCHDDKDVHWVSQQMQQWYGNGYDGYQNYAQALRVGRRDGPNAANLLNQLALNQDQPAIARATALSLLTAHLNRETFATLQQSLESSNPLIRLAAVSATATLPGELRASLLTPLLSDPQLMVRIETARVLADAPREFLDAALLDSALEAYIASQRLNADRPEGLVNLGALSLRMGKAVEAEAYLKQATELDQDFAPAYVNLADLFRAQGRESDVAKTLQQGLTFSPNDAALQHALGLSLVRSKDQKSALHYLNEAAKNDPQSPRYAYVLSVALYGMNQQKKAIQTLESSLRTNPTHRDTLFALIQFNQEQGNKSRARLFANRFGQLWPSDPRSRQLKAIINQ